MVQHNVGVRADRLMENQSSGVELRVGVKRWIHTKSFRGSKRGRILSPKLRQV